MKTLPKVLLSRTAPSDWETSRLALEGSFYLSEAYAGVLAAQGCEPVFLVWRNDTQVQGMALGFLTDQWRGWPIRLFVRNFRWQTHPVVRGRDHDRWTDFVKAILKRIESLRVMAITLGSEDARENPEVGDFSDFTAIRRWEFRVALDADPAMVLGRIAARKRTYLRAALKAIAADCSGDARYRIGTPAHRFSACFARTPSRPRRRLCGGHRPICGNDLRELCQEGLWKGLLFIPR